MSDTPIFSAIAPQYYARGLSVIPLWPHDSGVKSAGKRPIPTGWQTYATVPVPEYLQQQWLHDYPNANIGLVCGPQSRIVFIDMDSTDLRVAKAVKKALGVESPWIRIGKKGFVAAYRYGPNQQNFKIHGTDGKPMVECLAIKSQAVIPPSIHPDTKMPYTANVNLLEVIDFLPQLPDNLEAVMRAAIQAEGIELSHTGMSNLSDFVARGARDNQMTMVAGLFAHYVTRGERSLQEALGEMRQWYETNVQKVAGDDIELDKGMKKIVEFLERDVLIRKKPLPLGWDRALEQDTKTALDKIFTTEHQEWSAADLKAYACQQFMTFHDVDDKGRMDAVHYIIERLARSPSLNNLDQESIIAYIAQTSRIPGMTIPNIRKRIRELRQGEISGSSHMEIATAVKERMEEFGMVRQLNGIFYQWKGAQWDPLDDGEILKIIAEQFDGFDITKKQNDHIGVLKILRVTIEHGLTYNQDMIYGVNFANGFLQFVEDKVEPKNSTLVLKPHMPEFGATYTLPYRYMPELAGQCADFHKLLHDSWSLDPDYEDKVELLQQMMATTFFGYGTVIQRCCLLQGVANSGKSTILHIVKGLFPPDQISVVSPDKWEDKFAPAMMAGKIMNVCYELPDKKMIEGKSFKEIIDGSEQTGQFKNQQLFKFVPRATHWFGSNDLPRTLDTSEGFNRRWGILRFNRPIELKQKILGLHNNIIAAEREAIAAWAIEAFLPLIIQKEPTLPESHERLINDMANENNSVRFFLNESRRVLTRKRVKSQLAAQALEAMKSQPDQEEVEDNVIPLAAGQVAPLSAQPRKRKDMKSVQPRWKTVEEFDAYASSNLISEDAIFMEYTMFCNKQAGVRAAGVRVFRGRLRELEHMHGFKTIVSQTKDGYETCSYSGILLVATSPLSG